MYESTQNEVKRKMIALGACNAVPKSPAHSHARKILRDAQLHSRGRLLVLHGMSVVGRVVTGLCPVPAGRSPATTQLSRASSGAARLTGRSTSQNCSNRATPNTAWNRSQ